MSDPTRQADRPRATHEERLPTAKIAIVGAVTLLVFGTFVFITDQMRKGRDEAMPLGPAPIPAEVGKPEIGIVDQEPFELENRATLERQAQLRQLDSYGWVDRDGGVIHIPIRKAMERVTQEQW